MENWGKWKLIKAGFWLGVGFIIPLFIVMYFGTALTIFAMPSMIEASIDSGSEEMLSSFNDETDRTRQIRIVRHREQKNGNQLLILGSVENIGDQKASSIQLEAELMDSEGNFVFECSEYINRDLIPGDRENFQIKCGCGDNPVPEYARYNVRVVSASSY